MVEIVPQKPKFEVTAWKWPLWVSIIIFFLAGGIFIFFKVYLAGIQSDIIAINNQIKTEAAKVSLDDVNTIAVVSDSLAAFKKLVDGHVYFSEFFATLSSLTHARVAFSRINIDREKNQLQVRGTAQSYTILAKQMVALREYKDIKSLEVRNISFTPNGVEFELTATIDPAIFSKKQQ